MRVVSHPEFLREGSAVRDFFEPVAAGGGRQRRGGGPGGRRFVPASRREGCLVSLRTAEMIKYACNAFHAVKITFANEIGALSEQWAWMAAR